MANGAGAEGPATPVVVDKTVPLEVTAPGSAAASESVQVQRAFSLGWHVTELYHYERLRQEPDTQPSKSPPDKLPGITALDQSERRAMLVRQIKQDLAAVWGPAAEPPELIELEQAVVAASNAPPEQFMPHVLDLHKDMLSGLTVADFRLGKSYGLARALAESSILPCASAATDRQDEKGGSDASKARHSAFKQTLSDELDSGRVAQVQGWLYDLRDYFPTHAADAVATTLGGWALWMIRPTIGDRRPVRWGEQDDRDNIERALRRQGDVWRGLLSGEKNPQGMLSSDYYFAAIRSLLSRIARLGLRFLGTGIGFLLLLIIIVAAIGLYFSSSSGNGTGVVAAVITFLGSLGITAGSAWAAVQKALAKAEEPLWQAELAAAVAAAAWHNPAPLGSIEEIQLLQTFGSSPDPAAETRARHPGLTALRNLPVGRVGVALIVASTAIGLFGAGAGWLQRDAAFFLAPLCIVVFLAAIDGWDLLIGVAARQTAPYLALPERIVLPDWALPLAEVLAPVLLVTGVLAGHYFWH